MPTPPMTPPGWERLAPGMEFRKRRTHAESPWNRWLARGGGGEGGIRTHGADNRTTAFETVLQAQIDTGGNLNSRWPPQPTFDGPS